MKPDLSLIPVRSTAAEKRKRLNRAQSLFLAVTQLGKCGCGKCGKMLDPLVEGVVDEHVIALDLGGTNDIGNRSLWRRPCAKAKTAAEGEPIAKGRRIRGDTGNAKKRPIRSNPVIRSNPTIAKRPNPWPEGRKMRTHPHA